MAPKRRDFRSSGDPPSPGEADPRDPRDPRDADDGWGEFGPTREAKNHRDARHGRGEVSADGRPWRQAPGQPTAHTKATLDGATVLFNPEAPRAGLGLQARLVVIGGPRRGAEHPLAEQETSIGRAADNAWVIPDISVSRRHVLIRRTAVGYAIEDQGSGNGTMVNGELLVSARSLKDQDQIVMGDTALRFEVRRRENVPRDEGSYSFAGTLAGAARAVGKLAEGRNRLRWLTLVLALVGVGAAAWLLRGPVLTFKGISREELGSSALKEGMELYRAERFEDARSKLTEAAELLADSSEAKRDLAATERELAAKHQLEAAQTLVPRGKLKEAMAALAHVDPDSLLHARAAGLERKVHDLLAARIKDARAKLTLGDIGGARETIRKVLEAEPDDPDAARAREEIEEKEGAVKQELIERERAKDNLLAAAEKNRALLPLVEAQAAFLGGDAEGALKRAGECQGARAVKARCKVLAGRLRAFVASYQDGTAAASQKRYADAIRALGRAKTLAHQILPEGSTYFTEIGKSLGALDYEEGMAARDADQQAKAMRFFQAAIAADAQHLLARQQLADLKDHAHNLYLQAYVNEKSEPDKARQECYQVVELAGKGDADRAKCQKMLERLGRGGVSRAE